MPITINGSGSLTGVSVGGLPAGIVDTDMLAASAVTAAKATGARSIGYADQWRLTSSFDGEGEPISSNWERIDNGSPGVLGTAMSVSSGIWTFPATGMWHIRFERLCSTYNVFVDYTQTIISCSTDNFSSNYDAADHYPVLFAHGSAHNYVYSGCQYLFDVQDTSNYKCRFGVNNAGDDTGVRTYGDTNTNYSYVTFIRLGDT